MKLENRAEIYSAWIDSNDDALHSRYPENVAQHLNVILLQNLAVGQKQESNVGLNPNDNVKMLLQQNAK